MKRRSDQRPTDIIDDGPIEDLTEACCVLQNIGNELRYMGLSSQLEAVGRIQRAIEKYMRIRTNPDLGEVPQNLRALEEDLRNMGLALQGKAISRVLNLVESLSGDETKTPACTLSRSRPVIADLRESLDVLRHPQYFLTSEQTDKLVDLTINVLDILVRFDALSGKTHRWLSSPEVVEIVMEIEQLAEEARTWISDLNRLMLED